VIDDKFRLDECVSGIWQRLTSSDNWERLVARGIQRYAQTGQPVRIMRSCNDNFMWAKGLPGWD